MLLIRIYDAEGLSQEELAGVLYLDKAVVTRSLTLLEQKGLIRRDARMRSRSHGARGEDEEGVGTGC